MCERNGLCLRTRTRSPASRALRCYTSADSVYPFNPEHTISMPVNYSIYFTYQLSSRFYSGSSIVNIKSLSKFVT